MSFSECVYSSREYPSFECTCVSLCVQVQRLLERASKNRAVAATQCNERSSRSHSVFILTITGKNKTTGENCRGKCYVVYSVELLGPTYVASTVLKTAFVLYVQCTRMQTKCTYASNSYAILIPNISFSSTNSLDSGIR